MSMNTAPVRLIRNHNLVILGPVLLESMTTTDRWNPRSAGLDCIQIQTNLESDFMNVRNANVIVVVLGLALLAGCGTTDQTTVGAVGGADAGISIGAPDSAGNAAGEDAAGGGQNRDEVAQPIEEEPSGPVEPCLLLDSEFIDFQRLQVGAERLVRLNVTNCSVSEALELEAISIRGGVDDLRLELDVLTAGALAPGNSRAIGLLWAPDEAGVELESVLEFESNDPNNTVVRVPIVGTSVEPGEGGCVRTGVVCTVRGAGRIPTDELTVDLLSTLDCDAIISQRELQEREIEYQWSVSGPESSSTSLANTTEAATSLFLDAAGTYRVELQLLENGQGVTCSPAFAVVFAQPGEDIAVELTWVTPGDSNRDDSGAGSGSDLDLHFLRRGVGACWNNIPYDCHWRNKLPDWGVVGDDNDNAGLDLDDTDGWGPENVNLNNPQDGVYSVGVEHWDDWSFGPSTVQVRVYVFGELRFEAERTLTAEKQFWHVADVSWPDGRVELVDRVYSTIPAQGCE
jgi:hypothetical protein